MKAMPVRTMRWSGDQDPEPLLTREWLVTNGRGGYASGSIAGVPTRRFHGLLVAALPTPIGRAMMLNHLFEKVRLPDGSVISLGGYELAAKLEVYADPVLREFRLEGGLPVWRFELATGAQRFVLEKRISLEHGAGLVSRARRRGHAAPQAPTVGLVPAARRRGLGREPRRLLAQRRRRTLRDLRAVAVPHAAPPHLR
jgi:hypothetical protein